MILTVELAAAAYGVGHIALPPRAALDAVEAALQGSFVLTERAIDAAENATRSIQEYRGRDRRSPGQVRNMHEYMGGDWDGPSYEQRLAREIRDGLRALA